MNIKKTILLAVFLTGAYIATANPNVIRRGIKVYMTESIPVIDGKIEDKCWKRAACAKDFMLEMKKGKLAAEKTEVYICYDAKNLYLFWKVYESNMPGVKLGPPPDVKDKIELKEAVYLFINTGFKGYYRFAASPMGAQLDELRDYSTTQSPGMGYESPWQAKSGRFAHGWTMEMAIPFTALQNKGSFSGTPEPGSSWTMNLCRRRYQGEVSQWCLTSRCWRNYGCFGTIVFEGTKGIGTVPLVIAPANNLIFGENKLEFERLESNGIGNFEYKIKNNGKIVSKRKLKVNDKWTIPLKISNGGKWQVDVKYSQNKKDYYIGRKEFFLAEILPLLKKLKVEIPQHLKKLKETENQFPENLKTQLGKIEKILSTINFINQYKSSEFNNQQWLKITQAYDKIIKDWRKIKFQAFQLSLFNKSNKNFVVKMLKSDAKIYPDKVPEYKLNNTIELSLAGNETRSLQLLLIPLGEEIKNIKIKFSGLKSASSMVPSRNLNWYNIEYVKTQVGYSGKYSMEPDILLLGKQFNIPKAKLLPVWINIHLPKGTSAGKYIGKFTVSTDNKGSVSGKIIVNAFGFDLPDKMSVRHNHWLDVTNFKGTRVTPEVYEKAMRILSKYRVQPYFFDHRALARLIKMYYEPDGSFSVDFSPLDEYFRIAKKYNANAYWSAMSCGVAVLVPFVNPNGRIIERSSGKRIKLKDCPGMKEWIAKYSKGKEYIEKNPELAIIKATEEQNKKIYFDTNPLYKAYLKDYVKYLKKLGIEKMSYFELYDEAPQLESRWLDMIRHHKFLRKWVPELKLFNFEVTPEETINGESAIGLIDAWAPQLFQCDDKKMLAEIKKRQKNNKEEFWFYVCTERSKGPKRVTPYTWRYRPLIGARIIPWFAWWLQVDGFHVNSFTYQHLVKYQNGHLLPTMRLAMIRDGMEDYEYFAMLRKILSKINRNKNSEFFIEAEKSLKIESSIIKGVYDWTKSSEQLDSKRKELAKLIIKGIKILKQKGNTK